MERIDRTEEMVKVLDYIKTQKNPVGKKAIVEATGYAGDFAYCVHTLMSKHDELKVTGIGRARVYSWSPKKALYSEMKNPEGYPDSTAGKAIANVMKSDGRYHRGVKFGDVWKYAPDPDKPQKTTKIEGILIVSAKSGICIGYNVYPEEESFMKDGYTLTLVDKKGVSHYISTLNIVNTKERKLESKIFAISPADRETLKTKVSETMDIFNSVTIKTVETPVEVIKEVEKVVEKPVEVIKEVVKEIPVEVPVEVVKPIEIHAEEREIEMAVLKAKCEIYERLLFGQDSGLKLSQEKQAV